MRSNTYKITFFPTVKGIINKDNKPSLNYKISFSTKDVNACNSSDNEYLVESMTNKDGQFSLSEKKSGHCLE